MSEEGLMPGWTLWIMSASLASGTSSGPSDRSNHGPDWSDTMGSQMRDMDARGEASNCGRIRP